MMHNNNNVFVDEEVTTKPVLIYILSFNPLGYKMIGLANCFGAICLQTIDICHNTSVFTLPLLTESKFLSSSKTNEVIRVQQKPRINQSSVKRIWLIARQ